MNARPLADDVRAFQVIWTAIVAGALLAVGVLWWIGGQTETPAMADSGDGLFLATAAVSVATIVAGFALQRMIPARAAAAQTETGAMNQVRALGLASLAVMEASALMAGVATFLTGNALNLAFLVPFLAFAALFFPSPTRIAGLLRR